MKIIKITVLLLCLSFVVKTSSDAGIKLGLNEDTIEGLKEKFLEIVNKKIANINMNDYKLQPISLLFWELNVQFDNINFRLLPINPNQVIIKFNEPNIIQLEIDEIRGSGGILGAVDVCSFGSQIGGYIKINNIQIISTLTIDQVQSAVEGKFLPSVQIEDLSADVTLTVNLTGNWAIDYLNKFLTFVNGYFNVYNYVAGNEISKLKDYFNNEINEILGKMNPIYEFKGIIPIDLTLVKKPVINNDVLVLEMVGATNNTISVANNLPQINTNLTSSQILISQSIFQTIISNIYSNNLIKFNSQTVPQVSELLSSNHLYELCPGLESNNDITRSSPSYIKLSSTPTQNNAPIILIENGDISIKFTFTFEIFFQTKGSDQFTKLVQFDFDLSMALKIVIEFNKLTILRMGQITLDNAVVDKKYLNTQVNLYMLSPVIYLAFGGLSSTIQDIKLSPIEQFIIDSTEISYSNNYMEISIDPVVNK